MILRLNPDSFPSLSSVELLLSVRVIPGTLKLCQRANKLISFFLHLKSRQLFGAASEPLPPPLAASVLF